MNPFVVVAIVVAAVVTVVFPAPIMSTIEELGSFMAREQEATRAVGRDPGMPAT